MDREQYLLLKLMEECSELAQIASKCIQFGFSETKKDETQTNFRRLHGEFNDLLAIIELLSEEEFATTDYDKYLVADKKAKIERYYQYSKKLGKVRG